MSFEAVRSASPLVFDGEALGDPCSRSLFEAVQRQNESLAQEGNMLFPTGAHPFSDVAFWPSSGGARLTVPTDLQPFVPAVLPLLPAVAASSPFLGGRSTTCCDSRLEHHFHERAELAFDLQECPAADVAIADAVLLLLRALAGGRLGVLAPELDMGRIELLQEAAIKEADMAICEWPEYLAVFGFSGKWAMLADLWDAIAAKVPFSPLFMRVLHRGPLARTLLNWMGNAPTEALFFKCYGQVNESMQNNEPFF
jgi:hypothetical protein